MGKVTLLQDNKVAIEIKGGQHAVFQAKAGKKYQLIQETLSKDGKHSNIIAVKKGAHLVLMMPDNTELVIENFYLDCAANQCSIETNQVTITTKSGNAGPASGDNALVYAEGDVESLKQISRHNPYISDALSHYSSVNGHLSVTPGDASPTVTGAVHTLGSVSSVVGGPGIALALAGAGAAGNTSTSASNSFTLDTLAPSSPMLSLAAGIADGATNAEAKSATGVVNLLSEFGSNISVVLSKTGVTSINKSFTSTGSNIAVVLSDSELTSLGTGEVTLSAIATDSSGNTSLSSLINFNVI